MAAQAAAAPSYDDLDRHMAAAGSIERAVVPMGMYLAWCTNHQLLSRPFQEDASDLLLRLRFREVTGSEVAVAACGGSLGPQHLNEEGRAFTEAYYDGYLDDFCATFGPALYDVEDNWDQYDRIARVLTRRLMDFRAGKVRGSSGGRGWWKFWR